MQMPRILLIDDDEDYALFMGRLLARLGLDKPFDVVHDERGAMRAVADQRYDLVVCDLELHPGNGVNILEAVRKAQPEAQRILLTSAPDRARRQIRARDDDAV